MKSIYDKDFRYTPSCDTDIRKRFDEARATLEAERKRAEEIATKVEQVVARTRIKGKT